MKCENCGAENPKGQKICFSCGKELPSEKKNKEKLYILIIIILILIIAGLIAVFIKTDRDADVQDYYTQNENITNYVSEEQTGSKAEAESTYIASHSETTEIPADKLYRPDSSLFCNQYTMFVSGNSEGQAYAKMRFGPGKTHFNVVGQIENGNKVTVQTGSVNGWTLIYFEEKEGWVRTDFLYKTYDECFPSDSTETVYPDISVRIPAYADVTGEYDGESLNMRSGPDRSYSLLTTVPDESCVTVLGYSETVSTWVYISYKGSKGWVLSKYVDENSAAGDKPVLYLYPEEKTDVSVKVNMDNMYFTCSYPEYNSGWNVTAYPGGKIINKADGAEYSYLYYELGGHTNYDFSKGFVVKGSDTAEFLREKLSYMGLSPVEYNEFIVYWLPEMQNNPYNFITFQNERYTDEVELDINPAPDSVLRIFMAYKPLERYIEAEPQELKTFERKGFCAVEWGGVEIED